MNNKTQQNNKGFADFVAGYMELLTKHGVLPEGDGIDFEGVDSAKTATVDLLGFLDSICELNDEPGPVGNLADLADEDGVLSFTHEQKQALTNEVTGAFNKVGVECPHCIGMHLSGMAEMLLSTPMDDGVSDGHDVH